MSNEMMDEEVPAKYINRFVIRVPEKNIVRMAFGEALVGKTSVGKEAVTMSVETAMQLAETIVKVITAAKDQGLTS